MVRIKHIAIRTPDPEKTAAFYKDVFGLKEVGLARAAATSPTGTSTAPPTSASEPREEPAHELTIYPRASVAGKGTADVLGCVSVNGLLAEQEAARLRVVAGGRILSRRPLGYEYKTALTGNLLIPRTFSLRFALRAEANSPSLTAEF